MGRSRRIVVVVAVPFDVEILPDSRGGFTITVPSLPGCISEAETRGDVPRMAREAISVWCEAAGRRVSRRPSTVECNDKLPRNSRGARKGKRR